MILGKVFQFSYLMALILLLLFVSIFFIVRSFRRILFFHFLGKLRILTQPAFACLFIFYHRHWTYSPSKFSILNISDGLWQSHLQTQGIQLHSMQLSHFCSSLLFPVIFYPSFLFCLSIPPVQYGYLLLLLQPRIHFQ